MFDVLPRSLFNGGNGGIQLSYRYDTALSLTICNGVQNHLAPKTLHSYFTLFKLLYASSIHTRSSSPHVTDHLSQLAQEDFVSEQKSQAVIRWTFWKRIRSVLHGIAPSTLTAQLLTRDKASIRNSKTLRSSTSQPVNYKEECFIYGRARTTKSDRSLLVISTFDR